MTESHTQDEKALNLFSRQNAALGAETTAKLSKMKVLIYGMRSVGVETAKNLALQGVGGITLVDMEPTAVADLGLNFFLRKEELGSPRAQCVLPRLRELNPLCIMATAPSMDAETVCAHSAVVVTRPLPIVDLTALNELCRTNKIAFFYCFTGGVCSSIFTDLGDDHVVHDFDGEKPVQKLITSITALNETELLVRYDTPEGQPPMALSSGFFELSEVHGMPSLNMQILEVSHPWKDPVKTVRVSVPDTAACGAYVSGGLLTEKKVPVKYPMVSLADRLQTPGEFVSTDLLYFGSEMQLHVAFYATHMFFSETGRLPGSSVAEHTARVVELSKQLLGDGSIAFEGFDLDESVVTKYAAHAGVELQAMGAFLGGVLAQEVVKCTGKFTPIPGFMHFWAPESLPEEAPPVSDTVPRGHPNDELAAVYGWSFVEKLGDLNYFMVGCGALGCEFMKNFALNGICCGPTGKLSVTDADRIELSNLSRQFLFREHNVGQPKSKAASEMARTINPAFNVAAMELFVGPKTENIFNDGFWTSLDGVCNALDNMEARLYVDRMCVKYEKSLLESGTMGTAGNVDTICPFKTRTYADGGSAAETGGVPMCTLRNFPHLTEHCIEWARDQFELLFAKLGKSCESYLIDPVKFESSVRSKAGSEAGAAIFDIRSAISFAKAAAAPSIGSAAQLGFDLFHYLFRDRILDLQAACPADMRITDSKTGEDKGPFWIKEKRYPKVLSFDIKDPAHLEFLLSATCLFGVALRILPVKKEDDSDWLKEYRGQEWIAGVASGLTPPAYIPAPVGKLTEDESSNSNAPTSTTAIDSLMTNLLAELSAAIAGIDVSSRAPTDLFDVADFEKDDDLNFHISFISSTANMRCDNYHIKRTDFHSCKVIAGKIIAAIATTTAAVCGLVMLELFKLHLKKPTEAFMNRQIGLSTNTFTSFTQEEPVRFKTHTEKVPPDLASLPADAFDDKGKVKDEYIETVVRRAYPEDHSTWDKLTCNATLTLKQFDEWLKNEHGLRLSSWDFTYGYKTVVDADSKEKRKVGVSAGIYPPKVVLDYSLLPSIDLTLQQATQSIMRSPAAKPMQQYLALWRECKAAGAIPAQPVLPPDTITADTTIVDILKRMAHLAEVAESTKSIDLRAISGVEERSLVVIPGPETPACTHLESGDEVEHMCAIKFLLP